MVQTGLINGVFRLVLIGAGPAHVSVLRSFARYPAPADVTVIAPSADTLVSALGPAVIAGERLLNEASAPLAPLARAAQASYRAGTVERIDLDASRVILADGRAAPFDLLSINAEPQADYGDTPGAADYATPLHPVARFLSWWRVFSNAVRANTPHVAVVGDGAPASALALAIARGPLDTRVMLSTRARRPAVERSWRASQLLHKALKRNGVEVALNSEVLEIDGEGAKFTSLGARGLQAVIWARRPRPPAFVRNLSLPAAANGALIVERSLASTGDPRVFAAGPMAAIEGAAHAESRLPPEREGALLAANLRRAMLDKPLATMTPQRPRGLVAATGDDVALIDRGLFSSESQTARRKQLRHEEAYLASLASAIDPRQ